MSRKRTSLKRIRKLIKGYIEGITSSRELGDFVGISHSRVQVFLRQLRNSSYSFEELSALDEEALRAIVYSSSPGPESSKPMPDYEKIHKLLSVRRKTGITRTLLWQEYREEHPDGYGLTQFNEHYRRWVKAHRKPSLPQERIPGERLYPDYSGLKMYYINRETGEQIDCELYVSSLGYSGKIYVEASHTQSIPDWLKVTGNAFDYYGGVSSLINPDNLKSAVLKPDRYDPENNPVFEEFCDHYGTAIYAARVRHPKDKALAESAVQNVQRWIVAPLRNTVFFSLWELNEGIREKLELLNDRQFSVREGSRSSVFEDEDLPALKPLPRERFEYAEWKKVKVHPDCHIQYDLRRYSVHYSHIGKSVAVRATANTVEIFLKNQRIASHARLRGRGRRSTCDEHLPPAQKALNMMGEKVRRWVETRLGNTLEISRRIYNGEKHPTLSVRRIQGLMSLERKYGSEEFEKACGYALRTDTEYRHRTLSNILKYKPYDRNDLFEDEEETVVSHNNIRGGNYYT